VPYRTWATNDVPSAADFNNLFADPVTADVVTSENSTATTYGDLTTAGPAVTLSLVNGQTALVSVSALMTTVSSPLTGFMSFAVSGSTTLAAADANAAIMQSSTGQNQNAQGTRETVFTATATGSHTFTAKYKVSAANTVAFQYRRIIVKKF